MSKIVYEWRGNSREWHPASVDDWCFHSTDEGTRYFGPGSGPEPAPDVLAMVAGIVVNTLPGYQLFVGPRLIAPGHGDRLRGEHLQMARTILLSHDDNADLVATAWHEVHHAMWHRLPWDDRDTLESYGAQLRERARDYGANDGDENEWCARAFEWSVSGWGQAPAMVRDLLPPLPVVGIWSSIRRGDRADV